jgi:hypothetical protein
VLPSVQPGLSLCRVTGQEVPTASHAVERGRKALQAEQRKVQRLQAALTAAMRQQQEVQAVMRQCLEDAQQERQSCGDSQPQAIQGGIGPCCRLLPQGAYRAHSPWRGAHQHCQITAHCHGECVWLQCAVLALMQLFVFWMAAGHWPDTPTSETAIQHERTQNMGVV